MDARPIYTETPPPEGGAALVLNAWQFETPPGLSEPLAHAIPPDGCVSLVWTPAGVIVLGPRMSPYTVHLPPGSFVRGLRLWPDAAQAVLGTPAGTLREVVAPAAVVAPEALLRADLPQVVVPVAPDVLDPLMRIVVRAVVEAGGTATLAALADAAGRSERQVQRRFRAAVGLTIKEFSRIRRFREAARQALGAGAGHWGAVAYAAGYADQAHLSREFAAIGGRPPESFRRWMDSLEHRDVQP